MSSQLDRLRRLQGLRNKKSRSEPELPAGRPSSNASHRSMRLGLDEAAPGEVIENHAGQCYVVTRRYVLGEPRGPRPLGALLEQTPATLAALYPNFGLERQRDFLSAAFIDTETTGLGAGAGVYAFMVGVGTFEAPSGEALSDAPSQPLGKDELSQRDNPNIPNRSSDNPKLDFVVRQFFMRSPAEEGALLVALGALLAPHEMTVTFNGRTFDLPLLRTRFQQNHWLFPAGMDEVALLHPDRAHLDLLHPARRLWRKRLRSCRLINLEERVLGLHRSDEDVPGALIPQLYVDYTRNGDATQMGRVFYHNCEDIVSMVSLADALSQAFGLQPATAAASALPGADWLALGITLERNGALMDAESAYRHAVEITSDAGARGEAFLRLGQLLKRQARWDEAAVVWQEWLTATSAEEITPYVELAKVCEWQYKDLEQAEMWTGWALHNCRRLPVGRQNRIAIAELEHRLARIQRKRNA